MEEKYRKLYKELNELGFFQERYKKKENESTSAENGFLFVWEIFYNFNLDEEDIDLISKKLNKFLTNIESRISLMEWLISKLFYKKKEFISKYFHFIRYDPMLLQEFKVDIQQDSIKSLFIYENFKLLIKKGLNDIFKHIGISFSNKYSKNVDDYKLIEGTLGLEASLKFLLRIVKHVKIFYDDLNPDYVLKHKEKDIFYDKVLHECCLNYVNFLFFFKKLFNDIRKN
jgi:hypothetical protein